MIKQSLDTVKADELSVYALTNPPAIAVHFPYRDTYIIRDEAAATDFVTTLCDALQVWERARRGRQDVE